MSVAISSPAPTRCSPRETARLVRRQVFLEAAEQVFAERGFAGATMAEIAARAGYSAANIYNVFENKAALFQEVLTSGAEKVLNFTRVAGNNRAGFEHTLDQLIDAVLSFVAEHRGFFVILTQANPDFDWRHSREHGQLKMGERLNDENERLFARAIENGEIQDQDPAIYSCMFRGVVNAYISRWVRREGSVQQLWDDAQGLRIMIKRAVGLEPTRAS